MAVIDGKKWCPACEEHKPAAEFHRMKKSPDGLQGYCKTCQHVKKHGDLPGKRRMPQGIPLVHLHTRIPETLMGTLRWLAKQKGVSLTIAVTELLTRGVKQELRAMERAGLEDAVRRLREDAA